MHIYICIYMYIDHLIKIDSRCFKSLFSSHMFPMIGQRFTLPRPRRTAWSVPSVEPSSGCGTP